MKLCLYKSFATEFVLYLLIKKRKSFKFILLLHVIKFLFIGIFENSILNDKV